MDVARLNFSRRTGHRGEEITLTTRPVTWHEGEIPVQYHDLPQVVTADERILLDDHLHSRPMFPV